MSGERTERATPRRKQKAEEQGDRVHSRELTAACAMLAGVMTLGQIVPHWAGTWPGIVAQMLAVGAPANWVDGQAVGMALALRHVMLIGLSPLLLLFAAAASAALLVAMAQNGGVRIRVEAFQPKFSRLNPGSNLKNIFSMQGASRLAKSLFPVTALMLLAIPKMNHQVAVPPMSVEHLPEMFSSAYDLLLDTAWILFAWSAVDYGVQWRSREDRLRMSKQEMREEYKESEGSPQVRSRIRGLQRQMRRKKLKADVKRATVVITNPTHYAVALSFDFETMEPPKVLAKGRNLLAEQIKSEARWANVPIVENPPLARSLYRSVEEGQAIPVDLYAAVAAILAYLYRKQVEEKVRRQREEQEARQDAEKAAAKTAEKTVAAPPLPGASGNAGASETTAKTKENE